MGRIFDRIGAFLLYVLLICLTLWAGTRMIGYVLDLRFYEHRLSYWQQSVMLLAEKKASWPVLGNNQLMEYMDGVVKLMNSFSINIPSSNTDHPYIYILKKPNKPEQEIFILCLPNEIIMYNLSEETARRVDHFIDGNNDFLSGSFQCRKSSDNSSIIGVWSL